MYKKYSGLFVNEAESVQIALYRNNQTTTWAKNKRRVKTDATSFEGGCSILSVEDATCYCQKMLDRFL